MLALRALFFFDLLLRRKRRAFACAHESKTLAQWSRELQAVGDFKDFTYYPPDLRPKFYQLRASWTYMTDEERRSASGNLEKHCRAKG